jgi:hypothetical protein
MPNNSILRIVAPAAAGATAAALSSAPWWVAVAGIGASLIIDVNDRYLTHRERLAVLDTGSAEHCADMLTALNGPSPRSAIRSPQLITPPAHR